MDYIKPYSSIKALAQEDTILAANPKWADYKTVESVVNDVENELDRYKMMKYVLQVEAEKMRPLQDAPPRTSHEGYVESLADTLGFVARRVLQLTTVRATILIGPPGHRAGEGGSDTPEGDPPGPEQPESEYDCRVIALRYLYMRMKHLSKALNEMIALLEAFRSHDHFTRSRSSSLFKVKLETETWAGADTSGGFTLFAAFVQFKHAENTREKMARDMRRLEDKVSISNWQ